MKSSPVPFRILGRHNGNLIILRTYPDHVSISMGGETHSFPSYESAMLYLQGITKQNRYRERNGNDNHKRSPKQTAKRKE